MSKPESDTADSEPLVDCPCCGGSGFSGRGSGYDDVCDECGGQRQMPARFYRMIRVPCEIYQEADGAIERAAKEKK